MVTVKDLELEFKKRGWEHYLDFAVEKIKKGETFKDVFKIIADKDAEDFVKNLENPEKLYLPKSYMQGEAEVILSGKEKKEGFMEIKDKANIIPKGHTGQSPYKRGNILACKNNPEDNIE